ncbi:RecQ family ATP-dependent DNA helicase [Fructilactobacillus frigidiflavus]|uniref:RecQ family ATP-dependent DNA helicase n=1 Tax=Fructilactobacillus frigidiflavus TaxID=3242688 RepID=UPI003756A322
MIKINANQLLKQRFGFNTFHPGQAETLEALQAGENVLAILPTGAGKSLIYQLYSYLINQPVVIVSPLLSLMNDQVERIRYQGSSQVVAINSEYNWQERQKILANIKHYRYIFISPEMLNQPDIIKSLARIKLGLFVIDEAHCISKWGVDFRPDYLSLKNNLKRLGNPQTLMLTATASKKVQTDIIKKLGISHYESVIESVNRPNIFLGVHQTENELDKQEYLLDTLSELKGPGIVYFSSKRMANLMADMINAKTKLKAAPYHADLSNEDRFKIQHQFMDNELDVICATNAFGMGIDKSDIKFVIHYHLPQDLESYMQEIGRAGRNGQPSIAILLYATGDEQITQNLIENSLPTERDYKNYVNHKYQYIEEQIKRLLDFYFQHGYSENQIKLIFKNETTLKLKELDKLIDYINCEGCRRKLLLANFDEKFDDHTEICCNLNQANINLKPYDYLVEKQARKANNWKTIINQLF